MMQSMRRRLPLLAGLLAMALVAMACGAGGALPPQQPASTPCTTNCPPLVGYDSPMKPYSNSHFSFYYSTPPWSVDQENSDGDTVTLLHDSDYGQISAQFFAVSVRSGTSADALLDSWTRANLDTSQFAGLEDMGPVNGAEIGYVRGAGEQYAAVVNQPNAPNIPIYIQIMASTQGTSGIVFAAVSPLDPLRPDPTSPRQVRSHAYDQLVNTLTWL
jgi:hypothetical protein